MADAFEKALAEIRRGGNALQLGHQIRALQNDLLGARGPESQAMQAELSALWKVVRSALIRVAAAGVQEEEIVEFLVKPPHLDFGALAGIGSQAALSAVLANVSKGAACRVLPWFPQVGTLGVSVRKALTQTMTEAGQPMDTGAVVRCVMAAVAVAELGDGALGPVVLEAFESVCDTGREYHEQQCAGVLALALAVLDYQDAREALDQYLTRVGGKAASSDHTAKSRYAAWMLSRDVVAPKRFIETRKSPGASYAAAALADQVAVDALDALDASLESLHPVAQAAFAESIRRLREPVVAAPMYWMVWMLGVQHPIELADAGKTDNVFAQSVERPEASQTHDTLPPDWLD